MSSTLLRATACGVCVVFSGVSPRAADQPKQSIREYARANGTFESITIWTDKKLQLSDLVGQAELVVEASTAFGRTHFDETETGIVTDYIFNVHEIIKNRRRHEIRKGSTITVRRESGAMVVDGRSAVATENGFPEFVARDRYILFLKQWPGGNMFEVLGGPQGAFTDGEQVTSIATGLPLLRNEFLGEVRALLKFTE